MHSVVRDVVTVELIEVRDLRHDQPHYFSLTTTLKSTDYFHPDGTLHWSSSTIELDAVYFAGPSCELGRHVCVMGASTQHGDKIKLTNGGVIVDVESLRGLHLGSLVFGRIVDWAKQFPAHWHIVPISLSVIDARDPKAKEIRNKFYRRFGISFDYRTVDGIPHAEGSSHPELTVADLISRESPDNITLLGHWGRALQDLQRRFGTSRRELKGARRLASFYRRRLDRRTEDLAFIAAGLQWLFIAAAGVLGFALRGWVS